jgi:hypothetical protein
MKIAVICLLAITVFAAPCIYDAASSEPSPLNGLVAAVQPGKQAVSSFTLASDLLF